MAIVLVPGLVLQEEPRAKNPTAGDTLSTNHPGSRTYTHGGSATHYYANCPLALRLAISGAKHSLRLHPALDPKSVRDDGVLVNRPDYTARGPDWWVASPLSTDNTRRLHSQAAHMTPARPGVAPAYEQTDMPA